MENSICYIYALEDSTGIRYIEKADNVEKRFKKHYYESCNKNGKEYKLYKSRWFRKNVKDIQHTVLEECEYNKWPEREVYWITYYKDTCKLVNLSDGGIGGSGARSEECKEKIRQKALGRKLSTETKAKMSESQKKINRGYLADFHKGTNNPRSTKVVQYDLEGNKIKEWDYISQAVKELKLYKSGISECINGNQKTCGGFIWKRLEQK